jgi:hypothetical protein
MSTTTLESIETETDASSEAEKFVDKPEAIEKTDDISLVERSLNQGPDDEYVPPVLPEKEFTASPETILSFTLESPSAERIDAIILGERENDPTTIEVAEKIDTTLEQARNNLVEYEKAKAVAKDQLAVDSERKNVDQQFITAAQGPEQEVKQDIVASAKELIASFEDQTARQEATRLKIRALEQDIDDVTFRLESAFAMTEEEDEAMAKDGKKGLGSKLKSRFSYTHRTEELEQFRQKTIESLGKELASQKSSLSSESEEAEKTHQKLESMIFGDIPAKDFETTARSTIEQIRQLDKEFSESRKAGKKPSELIDAILNIDSLDASFQNRIDTILSRVEQLKDSGDIQKLPSDLREILTFHLNLEYIKSELKRARSTSKDGSPIAREEELDQYARNSASDMINSYFIKQIYGEDMCFAHKSDELKFTPTCEQLQVIGALMSDGVTVDAKIIETFSRSRERLELVANADRSYIAHVSTINRAMQVIESGGILSPDMIAANRGGEAKDYANSPHGNQSGIVGESYFSLNDIETTYLGTDRYDSKYRFEHMIDDPKGELGAVFVGNFGVIGSEKEWYMQQNSQSKFKGAEEVVLKMDSPLPVEEMHIFIEDTPRAVEIYANALAKSGRSEDWIKEHLVPVKGIRDHNYGGQIGQRRGGGDIIYQACVDRKILGQTDKEYVPHPEAMVRSQTNGGTVQTYKLKATS